MMRFFQQRSWFYLNVILVSILIWMLLVDYAWGQTPPQLSLPEPTTQG